MPVVGRLIPSLKSKPLITGFSRLILIPDHAQKSATTRRRRGRSPADLATVARSSANPRAGDRRPEMVLCPTLVALDSEQSIMIEYESEEER
jgi:hypothetical protein